MKSTLRSVFVEFLQILRLVNFILNQNYQIVLETLQLSWAAIVNLSQNPISPYYVLPSDNPSMKLVSTQFNGTGYNDRKRSMILSLSAKNKIGFIDGTINKLVVTDETYKS